MDGKNRKHASAFIVRVSIRLLALLGAHQAVAIENLALRMRVAALQRKRKRPLLTTWGRVFWISLRCLWDDWRKPLLYIQPDTVVRWQRERFRRFWARLFKPQRRRRGRPRTAAVEYQTSSLDKQERNSVLRWMCLSVGS